MPLLILTVRASDMPMHHWSFTLHGSIGILSTLESGETQLILLLPPFPQPARAESSH